MTTQIRGRAQVPWPLAGTLPSAGLAAEVYAAVAFISDNLLGRWSGSQNINASATANFSHNFNLSYDNSAIRVRLFQGGNELSEEDAATAFVISQVNLNTIAVQNISVITQTVEIYVEVNTRLRRDNLDPAFSARIKEIFTSGHNDTTLGTAATLGAATSSHKRLTSGSLVSVAGIPDPATAEQKLLVLTNVTGNTISILNEDAGATAARRILTGTGATLALANNGVLFLIWDSTTSRWRIVGGSGGGGFANPALQSIAAAGTISGVTSGFQKIPVQGNAAAVTTSTTPFGSTAPLDGTVVVLVGRNSTNTVTVPYTDAAKGFVGNGECTLFKGSTLKVIYDAGLDRWLEISRNIITIA